MISLFDFFFILYMSRREGFQQPGKNSIDFLRQHFEPTRISADQIKRYIDELRHLHSQGEHRISDQMTEHVLASQVRLIVSIAGRYASADQPDFDDYVQIGLQAVWDALPRFNPDCGVKPSTFFTSTIHRAIARQWRRDHGLNEKIYRSYRDSIQCSEYLALQLKRPPTDQELADYLQLSLTQLRATIDRHRLGQSTVSLDDPLSDETRTTYKDQLPAPDNDLNQLFLLDHVRVLIDTCLLPDERETIISYHYDDLSFDEIARKKDLARETIRKRYLRALKKLHTALQTQTSETSSTAQQTQAAK